MKSVKKLFKAFYFISLMLACNLLFVNCGNFSEDTGINVSSNEFKEARANNMPFAFDMDINHIAYMSCRGTNFYNAGEPFFTFKAGAYGSSSGIKLKDKFVEKYSSFTDDKIKDYLNLSNQNAGTGVVMSVRQAGQMQTTLRYISEPDLSINSPQISGLLFDPLRNLTLTQASISQLLLNLRGKSSNGDSLRLNYLKGIRGLVGRTMDGEIRLNYGDTPGQPFSTSDSYRQDLQNDSYLSFTFATSGADNIGKNARSPYSTDGSNQEAFNYVWGHGYQMTFSQRVLNRPSADKNVLTSVRGFNLEDGSSLSEEWVCPSDQRYIIVRPQDALRRYDGVAINKDNHPFNQYQEYENNETPRAYNDGGPSTGGYYYSYRADYDRDNELETVRHKVLCPTVADTPPAGGAHVQTDLNWILARRVLKHEDWYIFRGPKYNCIVPKIGNANACYGAFPAGQQGFTIQYFPNEDFPETRMNLKYNFTIKNPESTQDPPDVLPVTDCGDAAGNGRFCPHVLSICYKKK